MTRTALVALIVLFVASSALTAPLVRYVDTRGKDASGYGLFPGIYAFKTIQYAINQVDANDPNYGQGVTIWVADGIYDNNPANNGHNRNISFLGLTLTLQSENGPFNCIIDANGTPSDPAQGFIFQNGEDEEATVKGFTIKNGYTDTDGGGMSFDGASPTIINCVIVNNYAYWGGGGIACFNSGEPQLINCLIANNVSDDYAGGILCFDSSPTMELCTIIGNIALSEGGGVYCDNATPDILNCILWDNYIVIGTFFMQDDLAGGDAEATYSCVGVGDTGDGGISTDPQFITGPFGPYYLDQRQSPCVDHIPVPEDRKNIRAYDEFELGNVTTGVCNETDRHEIDMGFHYPFNYGPVLSHQLIINVIGNGHVHVNPGNCGDPNYTVYITDTHVHNGCCEIQLTAFPDPNHRVWKWVGTDDDTTHNLINTITLTSDTTVDVYFEPDEPHTYFVPSDYPGSLHPIQDAINNARDGDIITLAPDIYREQGIYLEKAITIKSEAPSDPAIVASTIIAQPVGEEVGHTRGITIYNVGHDTILEGLTFSGYTYKVASIYQEDMEPGENGYDGPPGYGGGIYLVFASPTIRYCVIKDCVIEGANGNNGEGGDESVTKGGDGGNPGEIHGSGVYMRWFCSPTFENCTIKNCTVRGGNGGNGGDGNGSDPFGDGGIGGGWNTTDAGYAQGAAAYIGLYCSPTFKSCKFSDNLAEGGTTGISGFSEPVHRRPEPAMNYTMDKFGGAVFCATDSISTFINCTFSDNVADPFSVEDNVQLDVSYGGAVCVSNGATAIFEKCSFTGNEATSGGAVFCIYSNPTFINCNMKNNSAFQGGALFAVHSNANLLGCNIEDNEAPGVSVEQGEALSGLGGGILYQATPTLINDCTIINNFAGFSGGGVYLTGIEHAPTPIELNNCLIFGNSAGHNGGGVSCSWDSEVQIRNCTIYNNDAISSDSNNYSYGGGLACAYRTNTTVTDSIIWGNTCLDPNGLGKQFSLGSGFSDPCGLRVEASLSVYYSDVQGGQAAGKIDWPICGPTLTWANNLPGTAQDSPLFVSGYYLSQTASGQGTNSPCVNRGSSLDAAASLPLGRFRYTTRTDKVYDTDKIDLGYHYRRPGTFSLGDITLDSAVDWADFVALARYWQRTDCNWPGYCEGSDINKNNHVGFTDLVYIVNLWLAGDTVAPTPNPMEWSSAPASASDTSVIMTAAAAVDNSGEPVQYFFDCREGGCHNSSWQWSRTYLDTGLAAGQVYAYSVKARDISNIETAPSPIAYVIPGVDTMPPQPNPSIWAKPPYASSATSVEMIAWIAEDPSGVEYYFDCTAGGGHDSGWQDSAVYEDAGLVLDQTYTYVVKTRDKSMFQNMGTPSEPNSATTEENPPGADHDPPVPNPTFWKTVPFRYLDQCGPGPIDACEQMSVVPATDENGVEYIFICEEDAGLSSNWQTEAFHQVIFEYRFVKHTWKVKARDMSPNLNEGGWSVRIRVNQPGSGFVVD